MKIKDFLLPILALIGFAIVQIFFFHVFYGFIRNTVSCEFSKIPIADHAAKVNPNGWIAENGGGGTLCTTNLGISARLDRIEKILGVLDSDVNEIKEITGHGCLFEIYLELGRAIDRNGHCIDSLSNRLERLERRTPLRKEPNND